MTIESLDDTAKKILYAASTRFLHYGYGKTTMSEIAKDCNMSTGNVYRYFPSKMDIAHAFIRSLQRDQIARLERIAADKALTPPDKLRSLLKAKLRAAYDRFHNRPKAYELSEEILKERPEFAVEWEAAENELIAAILEEGVAAGVFPPADPRRTAEIVQDAVFRFTSPAVFHEGDFEILSAELDDVIDLFLDAFAWRAGAETRNQKPEIKNS